MNDLNQIAEGGAVRPADGADRFLDACGTRSPATRPTGGAGARRICKRTYGEGRYRPYELLVREAAVAVGLPAASRRSPGAALRRAAAVARGRRGARRAAGRRAARRRHQLLGGAGPGRRGAHRHRVRQSSSPPSAPGSTSRIPRPYRLGLAELGVAPAECLFVAGSAYDLVGAAAVGLPVFWHDRIGMAMPDRRAAAAVARAQPAAGCGDRPRLTNPSAPRRGRRSGRRGSSMPTDRRSRSGGTGRAGAFDRGAVLDQALDPAERGRALPDLDAAPRWRSPPPRRP